MLAERLEKIRKRIDNAAARAGRDSAEICMVAVTKKFPAQTIVDAYSAGLRHFGENYVQEFETKAPDLPLLAGARFHLIGHLQSNKVRRAIGLFQMIQTVDSAKLAQRLDTAIAEEGRPALEVMLEVKLSGEEAKFGVDPIGVHPLAAALREWPNLKLVGLMTMPPWSDDPEASRPYFRRLRALADEVGVRQLSMGMSNDFEVAIEEGATIIRMGTALFGPRPKV